MNDPRETNYTRYTRCSGKKELNSNIAPRKRYKYEKIAWDSRETECIHLIPYVSSIRWTLAKEFCHRDENGSDVCRPIFTVQQLLLRAIFLKYISISLPHTVLRNIAIRKSRRTRVK